MEVTVYTKPECQGCKLTIKALDKAEIPYSTAPLDDVVLAEAAARNILAAPVVRVGDDLWGGFRPDRIAALKVA